MRLSRQPTRMLRRYTCYIGFPFRLRAFNCSRELVHKAIVSTAYQHFDKARRRLRKLVTAAPLSANLHKLQYIEQRSFKVMTKLIRLLALLKLNYTRRTNIAMATELLQPLDLVCGTLPV